MHNRKQKQKRLKIIRYSKAAKERKVKWAYDYVKDLRNIHLCGIFRCWNRRSNSFWTIRKGIEEKNEVNIDGMKYIQSFLKLKECSWRVEKHIFFFTYEDFPEKYWKLQKKAYKLEQCQKVSNYEKGHTRRCYYVCGNTLMDILRHQNFCSIWYFTPLLL